MVIGKGDATGGDGSRRRVEWATLAGPNNGSCIRLRLVATHQITPAISSASGKVTTIMTSQSTTVIRISVREVCSPSRPSPLVSAATDRSCVTLVAFISSGIRMYSNDWAG